MGRRLWFVFCLIALECIASWSDWKDSVEISRIHQTALQLHEQRQHLLQDSLSGQADGNFSSSAVESESQLDEKSWALLESSRGIQDSKLVWQTLSLGAMAAILGIGLQSFWVSRREARRRKQAEAELRAEQASLERRIEIRTGQLQAEVEVRSRAEERNRRQKRVLELLANGAPLKAIFDELTASVAVQRRSWETAVHLVDGEKSSLQLIASSKVSDWLEHYLREIAISFPDAPESKAWMSGEPRFIGSMILEHRPWSEFLVSNGIRSVWSLPLTFSDGKTAGTLTIYSRLFGTPDEEDQELLDSAVRLASLVVDVRRMNGELLRKAYEDELTGVANRRAGEIRIHEAITRAKSRDEGFAVLLIDLDRFKRMNDIYGHARGDKVLCEVAKRIARHSRVNGSVARMGGDEFLVLLESCSDEQHAREAAAELAVLINEPMELGEETTTIGASIGITLYPRDGKTPDELERHADAAMYHAKRRGTNYCVFSPAIHEEADSAISIEEGLREALDSEAGQDMLEVYYQPIYRTGGELYAFEALLRFRHPRLGTISPTRFIPIAEETKLIIPIGRWVLRQVCHQIVAWYQAGFPSLRVGVNISAVQWGREGFVEEVRSAMEESGAPATSLTLELTESAVMQNASRASTHMQELKAMGVRVAMDDFGTGYSSLSYLHQLPLDILKIDRSFIARLGQTDDSRAIVESIISMAHVLGMVTIAEGVETESQRLMLTEMGCDGLQGFLFAQPMRSAEAAALICDRSVQSRIVPKRDNVKRFPDRYETLEGLSA